MHTRSIYVFIDQELHTCIHVRNMLFPYTCHIHVRNVSMYQKFHTFMSETALPDAKLKSHAERPEKSRKFTS
jgi:hypothetical protein